MTGLLAFLGICLCAGYAAAGEPREITVSAAISLKEAFIDIGRAFEAGHKDTRVMFNFGSSGQIRAQIEGGAPADVYASAALKDMDVLEKDGLVIKDSRTSFASNAVVLVRPVSSMVKIASFDDLKKTDARKIAVGNPATVPAGRYAVQVLRSITLYDAVKDKLVLAENVRQVLDYVVRGEVDAGVVYSTDALTRPREVAVVATAPGGSHKAVLYPIAVVGGSKNEKTARAFIAFVRSDEGSRILERYGFKPAR